MSSTREYLDFVMDQLSELGDVSYRVMMGEFVIYHRGKVVGGVYDNRFMVKSTLGTWKILPTASMEIPYPRGWPMIMVEDIENCDLF